MQQLTCRKSFWAPEDNLEYQNFSILGDPQERSRSSQNSRHERAQGDPRSRIETSLNPLWKHWHYAIDVQKNILNISTYSEVILNKVSEAHKTPNIKEPSRTQGVESRLQGLNNSRTVCRKSFIAPEDTLEYQHSSISGDPQERSRSSRNSKYERAQADSRSQIEASRTELCKSWHPGGSRRHFWISALFNTYQVIQKNVPEAHKKPNKKQRRFHTSSKNWSRKAFNSENTRSQSTWLGRYKSIDQLIPSVSGRAQSNACSRLIQITPKRMQFALRPIDWKCRGETASSESQPCVYTSP